jgi:hypothetical protein
VRASQGQVKVEKSENLRRMVAHQLAKLGLNVVSRHLLLGVVLCVGVSKF